MKPLVKLLRLGLRAYEPTWKFQKQLVEKVKSERKDNFLIFVEHSPVYTTGIRSNVYDDNEELRLKNLGAEFYRYIVNIKIEHEKKRFLSMVAESWRCSNIL